MFSFKQVSSHFAGNSRLFKRIFWSLVRFKKGLQEFWGINVWRFDRKICKSNPKIFCWHFGHANNNLACVKPCSNPKHLLWYQQLQESHATINFPFFSLQKQTFLSLMVTIKLNCSFSCTVNICHVFSAWAFTLMASPSFVFSKSPFSIFLNIWKPGCS